MCLVPLCLCVTVPSWRHNARHNAHPQKHFVFFVKNPSWFTVAIILIRLGRRLARWFLLLLLGGPVGSLYQGACFDMLNCGFTIFYPWCLIQSCYYILIFSGISMTVSFLAEAATHLVKATSAAPGPLRPLWSASLGAVESVVVLPLWCIVRIVQGLGWLQCYSPTLYLLGIIGIIIIHELRINLINHYLLDFQWNWVLLSTAHVGDHRVIQKKTLGDVVVCETKVMLYAIQTFLCLRQAAVNLRVSPDLSPICWALVL